MKGLSRKRTRAASWSNLKGIRIFVPASQTGLRRNEPMTQLVGTTVRLHITEVNRARRRVVGSIRSVLNEERAAKSQEIWDNIEVDKHYQGVVKSLTSYGAFVDIGGVDGLVHISELSWKRIKHPSEVVAEGDVIETFILDANKETGKVSLGYKKAEDNPWEIAKTKFKVDDVVKATVLKVVPFGAFVELLPGVDGLIHISQIANKRIAKPSDELSVGQEVEAKIVEIDFEHKKIGLSIRRFAC